MLRIRELVSTRNDLPTDVSCIFPPNRSAEEGEEDEDDYEVHENTVSRPKQPRKSTPLPAAEAEVAASEEKKGGVLNWLLGGACPCLVTHQMGGSEQQHWNQWGGTCLAGYEF